MLKEATLLGSNACFMKTCITISIIKMGNISEVTDKFKYLSQNYTKGDAKQLTMSDLIDILSCF